MKKRVIKGISGMILVLVASVGTEAQTTFERVYDSPNNGQDTALKLIQTLDGGFALVGYSNGLNWADQYMIKTDGDGIFEWDRMWGNSLDVEYFRDVEQTLPDSNYVFAGKQAWQTDVDGFTTWSNNDLIDDLAFTSVEAIEPTSDGGYITCGYGYSISQSNNLQATLVKRSSAGDTLWTSVLGLNTIQDVATDVVQRADGGYTFIGSKDGQVVLTRTNALGVEISSSYYPLADLEAPNDYPIRGPFSLSETADNGYVFVAKKAGEEKMVVIKTDFTGSTQWTYEIGENKSAPFGGVKQTTDGGYIIAAGNRVSWDTQTRPYMVRLNGSGQFQWDRRFTTGVTGQFSDVIECTDGGFAACGTLRLSTNGPTDDFYLVKVNSNGNSQNPSCFANLIYTENSLTCGSEIVYFTSGSTFDQWYVNLNDQTVSNQEQGILTLEPGDYGLSLTAVTFDGCVSSSEDSLFIAGPFWVDAGPNISTCELPGQLNTQVTPPNNYTYQWTPAIPQLSNPNVASPTVSGNVDSLDLTVTVTDPNGCAVSDVVNVISRSQIFDTLDLCSGSAIVDLGSGAFAYQWHSWIDTNGVYHTLNYPQTTQAITVTEPGEIFAIAYFDQCAMTSLIPILPCTDCSNFFTYNNTQQTQCGTWYQFYPGATDVVAYEWDFGDGHTSTEMNPVHVFTPGMTGLYTVSLTTTDINGCVSVSSQQITATIGHTVFASNDTIGCQESAYMEAFVYGGSGDYSYEWSPQIGLDNPYSAVAHATGVHEQDYTIAVTDNLTGCVSIDSLTVSSYVAYFDTIYLCGDSVELDLGPGGDFYNWTPYYNDDFETQSIWVDQPGDYLAYAAFPACGAITSVFPVVECPSTCTSSIFNNGISYQNCFTYINLGANYSSPIDSAVWDMGNGDVLFDDGGGIPTQIYEGGNYIVQLTAYHTGGCVSTTSYGLNLLTDITAEINEEDTIACAGQLFLSASATGGGGQYTFYWPQSGNTTPTIVLAPTQNEWVIVEVYDTFTGCFDSDSIFVYANQEINQTIEMCQSSVPLMVDPGSLFYNWSFTDPSGTTTSLPNQTNELEASNLGTYNCMTYYSGCQQVVHTFEVVQCGTACFVDVFYNSNPSGCGEWLAFYATLSTTGQLDSLVYDYGDGNSFTTNGISGDNYYSSGDYTLTVTAHYDDGCSATYTEELNIGGNISVDIWNDSIACSGQVFLNATVSGGTGGYMYEWFANGLPFTGSTQPYPVLNQITEPTEIALFVTDSMGNCSYADTTWIFPNLQLLETYELCNDSILLTAPPYSQMYSWSHEDEFGNITYSTEQSNELWGSEIGTYYCQTYTSGCDVITHAFHFVTCSGSDDVWPGDANSDNIVTNADALYLGLAFNQTGPTRPAATLNWVGQACPDWTFNFAVNNVNLKHADCDGNGIVNFDDTLAIDFNYLNTHNKFEAAPPGGNPLIWIEATPDTVGLEQYVDIVVHLGTAAQPIDSLHGVAFSLTFDESLVVSQGLSVDFDNCVLGTAGVDVLTFQETLFIDGVIDIAVTRNTLENFQGYGPIAHARIVTTDNLSGYADLPIGVSAVTALTAGEEEVLLSTRTDTVVIDPNKVGIVEPEQLDVQVYPNPTKGLVTIAGLTTSASVTVFNSVGQLIYEKDLNSEKETLDLTELRSGIYILKLETDQAVAVERLRLIR